MTGESYFTFRLVASERTGKQVRQITLLNLGHQFDLPQNDWPRLCARIDALLAGQAGMLPEPEAIEVLAQRYAARLIVTHPAPTRAIAASPAPPGSDGCSLRAVRFARHVRYGLCRPAFRWRP